MPYISSRLKTAKPTPNSAEPRALGEHIRKRRGELGLLQKEVARQLHINEWTLGNWEKDRTCPATRYLVGIVSRANLLHGLAASPEAIAPPSSEDRSIR